MLWLCANITTCQMPLSRVMHGNMTVIFSSDSNEGPDYSGFEATFKAADPSNGR